MDEEEINNTNDTTSEGFVDCQPENPQQSLPPFHIRLIEEQKELEIKIKKLNDFLSPTCKGFTIDERQKTLMLIQLKAMETYNECLVERLNLLNQ